MARVKCQMVLMVQNCYLSSSMGVQSVTDDFFDCCCVFRLLFVCMSNVHTNSVKADSRDEKNGDPKKKEDLGCVLIGFVSASRPSIQ
jgi:hypothetical protein